MRKNTNTQYFLNAINDKELFVQELMHYIKYIVIFFRNSELTSPSESSIFSNTPEQEGVNWWAGFLVKMTRGMHRWMGTRTRDATNVSRWMQLKSRGGAIMPSPELLRFIEGAEKVFKEVHGLELDLQYNPIQRVIDILRRQRPEMDPLIIQAYSRARFFLRLNDLNRKLGVIEKDRLRKNMVHKAKYM